MTRRNQRLLGLLLRGISVATTAMAALIILAGLYQDQIGTAMFTAIILATILAVPAEFLAQCLWATRCRCEDRRVAITVATQSVVWIGSAIFLLAAMVAGLDGRVQLTATILSGTVVGTMILCANALRAVWTHRVSPQHALLHADEIPRP